MNYLNKNNETILWLGNKEYENSWRDSAVKSIGFSSTGCGFNCYSPQDSSQLSIRTVSGDPTPSSGVYRD